VGGGRAGCLVDLEGCQEVGTLGRSATDAHPRSDRPIKKRTRTGPLDDQTALYELLQRSVGVLSFQGRFAQIRSSDRLNSPSLIGRAKSRLFVRRQSD
jgi:hypothetical protein